MGREVNMDRVLGLFTELTALDALSCMERQVADVLIRELEDIGFEVTEDDAGANYGSDTGNLYGILRGTNPDKKPILLSAHMDTVAPGIGKRARVDRERDIITSAGDTVLGADDVAGLVEILEGIRLATGDGYDEGAGSDDGTACESGSNGKAGYGDIEVLFTIAEEVYAKGAKVFDYSGIKSDTAYVVDMSGPVGRAAKSAPSIISFDFSIMGRSAHAGFAPQDGINAIAIASDIISQTRQGLLDEGLTLNIGTISGGTASNIVSDACVCTGEARGSDHEAASEAVRELEALVQRCCYEAGAGYTFNSEVMIRAYETPESDRSCRDFARACSNLGLEGELVATRGGSDNNVFAQHGIHGIVVGCGMGNTHSTNEFIHISDLEKGSRLVAELIELS